MGWSPRQVRWTPAAAAVQCSGRSGAGEIGPREQQGRWQGRAERMVGKLTLRPSHSCRVGLPSAPALPITPLGDTHWQRPLVEARGARHRSRKRKRIAAHQVARPPRGQLGDRDRDKRAGPRHASSCASPSSRAQLVESKIGCVSECGANDSGAKRRARDRRLRSSSARSPDENRCAGTKQTDGGLDWTTKANKNGAIERIRLV